MSLILPLSNPPSSSPQLAQVLQDLKVTSFQEPIQDVAIRSLRNLESANATIETRTLKLKAECDQLEIEIEAIKSAYKQQLGKVYERNRNGLQEVRKKLHQIVLYLFSPQPKDLLSQQELIKMYKLLQGSRIFFTATGSKDARACYHKVFDELLAESLLTELPKMSLKFRVRRMPEISTHNNELLSVDRQVSNPNYLLIKQSVKIKHDLALQKFINQTLLLEKDELLQCRMYEVWKHEDAIRGLVFLPLLYKLNNLRQRSLKVLANCVHTATSTPTLSKIQFHKGYGDEVEKIISMMTPLIQTLEDMTAVRLDNPLDRDRLGWDDLYAKNYALQDEIIKRIEYLVVLFKPYLLTHVKSLFSELLVLCSNRKGLLLSHNLVMSENILGSLRTVFLENTFIPVLERLTNIISDSSLMSQSECAGNKLFEANVEQSKKIISILTPLRDKVQAYINNP